MMNPTIFDMREIAAQDLVPDEANDSVIDRLLDGLRQLPELGEPEATEELLELAAAYHETQPSYAADLRAAAKAIEAEALA